jgi:predicted lactoylglutathione lyase
VNELADKALAAGAFQYSEPQDYGWMYSRAFQDLDGHLWEVMYSDLSAIPASEG